MPCCVLRGTAWYVRCMQALSTRVLYDYEYEHFYTVHSTRSVEVSVEVEVEALTRA
jgi:hypothetical protein